MVSLRDSQAFLCMFPIQQTNQTGHYASKTPVSIWTQYLLFLIQPAFCTDNTLSTTMRDRQEKPTQMDILNMPLMKCVNQKCLVCIFHVFNVIVFIQEIKRKIFEQISIIYEIYDYVLFILFIELGCLRGYYGFTCNIPCSEHCLSDCHIETGNCQGCKPGYRGDRCESSKFQYTIKK